MLDDNLIIYPHLDLELPIIPTRSRFYQLEPIGIGTPFVESLTGYIVRLAESHCVSTRSLLSKELDPFLKKEGVSRKIIGLVEFIFLMNYSIVRVLLLRIGYRLLKLQPYKMTYIF